MNNMEKPIQLRIEDVKKNIINFVNDICNKNSIDYYFLEIILKDIYQETLKLKENELKEVEETYCQQLEKEKSEKNSNE